MIILASTSPRRTEILTLGQIEHQVVAPKTNEVIKEGLTPIEVVKNLAYEKAMSLINDYPNDLIIGADTIVTINQEILGKPHNIDDAIRMLTLLQNNHHQVITGVAIITKNKQEVFAVTTSVYFEEMTNEDIINYINNEYVYDKAGSYAIQGQIARFISRIDGDYYNVMGLPLCQIYKVLKQFDL